MHCLHPGLDHLPPGHPPVICVQDARLPVRLHGTHPSCSPTWYTPFLFAYMVHGTHPSCSPTWHTPFLFAYMVHAVPVRLHGTHPSSSLTWYTPFLFAYMAHGTHPLAHYISTNTFTNQNFATSGFEISFAIGSHHLNALDFLVTGSRLRTLSSLPSSAPSSRKKKSRSGTWRGYCAVQQVGGSVAKSPFDFAILLSCYLAILLPCYFSVASCVTVLSHTSCNV